MQYWILATVGCLLQTSIEQVIVLIDEPHDGVGHLSCVVQQSKLVSIDRLPPFVVEHFVCDKVLVLSDGLDELR